MGPRTEAAIRAFREASGIPEPFSDPWCLNAVLSRLHTLSIRTNTTPEAAVLEAAIEDLLTPETLRRQRRLAANWFEERNCEALRGLPAEALGDLTLENCVQARTREQQEQLAARYFQQRDCSATKSSSSPRKRGPGSHVASWAHRQEMGSRFRGNDDKLRMTLP